MNPDIGPMTVLRPPMPTTTATLSPSGPAPGQATAQTGQLPGTVTLKVTITPGVDGAVRVTTMLAGTPASMITEVRLGAETAGD